MICMALNRVNDEHMCALWLTKAWSIQSSVEFHCVSREIVWHTSCIRSSHEQGDAYGVVQRMFMRGLIL
jgi:hypothetical protein